MVTCGPQVKPAAWNFEMKFCWYMAVPIHLDSMVTLELPGEDLQQSDVLQCLKQVPSCPLENKFVDAQSKTLALKLHKGRDCQFCSLSHPQPRVIALALKALWIHVC